MPLTCYAQTDPGLRRPVNEDSYCARPELGLFVVADGLGGHPGGHVASRLVTRAIEDVIAGAVDPGEAARCDLSPSSEPETRLRNGFHVAYARLSMAAAGSEFQGMATTVAAALVETHQNEHTSHPAIVAHVGDSRVYRLHDAQLERLTRDHSWVEEQVRAGLLERDAARNHPWRSLITRAVSASEEEVEPDVDRFVLSPGDRLLICSDGLTGVLTDAQISAVMTQSLGDEPTCQALVHMANLAGGPDNITVIVVSL